ncbi:MAG: amidase [Planctomycetota bacterium]
MRVCLLYLSLALAAPLAFAQKPAPKPVDLDPARWTAQFFGLKYSDEQLELAQPGLDELRAGFEKLRGLRKAASQPPAIGYTIALAGLSADAEFSGPIPRSAPSLLERPPAMDALAFASIPELGAMLRARRVSCVELAQLSIARLRRLDPKLLCVAALCEERAMAQARRLDEELAKGIDRGPLHGIPYGAKDLLDTRGIATSWGSAIYSGRIPESDAAVIERLDAAGAVLVAKLSLGELAWGDVWYGGRTKNPWNLEQGSSGSSAGPASATAAGAVVFAIGSETCGSIVSPSTVCACSSLRPTFGRVSRAGAMELSWTMDKLGPLCRSVEDAGLVLAAIAGADARDPVSLGQPDYRATGLFDPRGHKLGFAKGAWANAEDETRALKELRELGFVLEPVEMPDLPISDLLSILTAEAASAFDEVTRSGKDSQMVRQVADAWPNVLRQGQLISAVDYLRAQRVRRELAQAVDRILGPYDAVVHPSGDQKWLVATNLTGHPTICAPTLRNAKGNWRGISFTGRAFGEARLLAVAELWQRANGANREHPNL